MPRVLLRSTALALVAVLVLGAAAAAAPARPPRIVPQVSIRGIQVGMTGDQVRRAAGRPDAVSTRSHPVLGRTRVWRYGRATVTFDGTRSAALVVSISTTSRADRTAKGAGIGSTEATVRSTVAGVRCLTELGYRHCVVGRWAAGQIVTDFSIGSSGRVTRVLLGRVID
jgi:hypothetical protein